MNATIFIFSVLAVILIAAVYVISHNAKVSADALKKEISEKDRKISTLNEIISQKSKMLDENDEKISRKDKLLLEQNSTIGTLNVRITELIKTGDETVEAFRKKIEELHLENAQLKNIKKSLVDENEAVKTELAKVNSVYHDIQSRLITVRRDVPEDAVSSRKAQYLSVSLRPYVETDEHGVFVTVLCKHDPRVAAR